MKETFVIRLIAIGPDGKYSNYSYLGDGDTISAMDDVLGYDSIKDVEGMDETTAQTMAETVEKKLKNPEIKIDVVDKETVFELNGKWYKDTVEYALDTHKFDKPVDPETHKGTIFICNCWDDWQKVVNNNKEAFAKMTVEEIDNAFHWFNGGHSWGMLLGMKMAG